MPEQANKTAWREYKSGVVVPRIDLDSGMSAQFWQDKNKTQWVNLVQPGQDFTIFTRYCYDGESALANVNFEVRTPLGWGHRIEGSVSGKDFSASTTEFFNLKDGKTIPKPDGVGDAPTVLKPMIYLKLNDLPFAPLLPVPAKPGKNIKNKKKPVPVQSVASNTPADSGAPK